LHLGVVAEASPGRLSKLTVTMTDGAFTRQPSGRRFDIESVD